MPNLGAEIARRGSLRRLQEREAFLSGDVVQVYYGGDRRRLYHVNGLCTFVTKGWTAKTTRCQALGLQYYDDGFVIVDDDGKSK